MIHLFTMSNSNNENKQKEKSTCMFSHIVYFSFSFFCWLTASCRHCFSIAHTVLVFCLLLLFFLFSSINTFSAHSNKMNQFPTSDALLDVCIATSWIIWLFLFQKYSQSFHDLQTHRRDEFPMKWEKPIFTQTHILHS